ncbi:MAG: hypothetical protein FVQ80_13125 [Planctomycetes bacterium]|nr:hypothetical protein [Planctomycetota bacterium]
MKNLGFLIIGFSVLLIGNSMVFAENEVGFELTSDYFGKYIWRGQNLSDDPVFELGLSFSYGNLTAGIWGNMDLRNINGNSGDFSEMDYSLDYSGTFSSIEGVGYSIGLIYYDFPGTTTKDTTEVYWELNFDLPLNPSITVYHDLDEAEGSYVSLAFGHSIERIAELGPDMRLLEWKSPQAWAGAAGPTTSITGEPSRANCRTLPFRFLSRWRLLDGPYPPSLNYTTLVSDDIRDAPTVYGTGDSDFFFAGINLSKNF